MRLKGKVALVTGASRGIGFAVAELFAREGAIVYAGSSSNPAGIFPAGVTGVELDVSKEEHWKRVVTDIVAAHGRLDVLVNNAGIAVYDALHDCSTENWRRILGVNQDGCFFGMREVIPHMKAHHAGAIINVSSIWGIAAVPGAHAYHATKGALVMMSKNAAITYAGDGIRVNTVHPGFIDTPLTQSQDPAINASVIGRTPMKRAGAPLEIANGCLFLASDESSFITGTELVIDGGYLLSSLRGINHDPGDLFELGFGIETPAQQAPVCISFCGHWHARPSDHLMVPAVIADCGLEPLKCLQINARREREQGPALEWSGSNLAF